MTDIERRGVGPRMSKIVIHNGTVWLAGQVGDPETDIQAQTREALSRVDALLAEAGTDKSHLLQTIVWLSDMRDFAAMNEIWDAWIDPENPPARACGEARLATQKHLVEFICVAALP